jgi:hypothetical protein
MDIPYVSVEVVRNWLKLNTIVCDQKDKLVFIALI